jgi:hypothetical protein
MLWHHGGHRGAAEAGYLFFAARLGVDPHLTGTGRPQGKGQVFFERGISYGSVGGSLIWRLVSVLSGPNHPPPQSVAGRTVS